MAAWGYADVFKNKLCCTCGVYFSFYLAACMETFWDKTFQEIKTRWGFEPAESALYAAKLFARHRVKNVLIPGIGYGRNVSAFTQKGMQVTGIELSGNAIKLAKAAGLTCRIYHGDVAQMPFDKRKYEGIFCYSLIHLLNKTERKNLIARCYEQLKSGGYMVFVMISKEADYYASGKRLSTDRYLLPNGLSVYFYDVDAAINEFKHYGLQDVREYTEPVKFMKNQPGIPCVLVVCKKGSD